MPTKLCRSAFEKLINENIEWLMSNTNHSLEREHILAILRDCPNWIYKCSKQPDSDFESLNDEWPENIFIKETDSK